MLHIILFILKIIGILLLTILGLILLVLTLVLLVPIRYRASLQKISAAGEGAGKQTDNLTSVGDTIGNFLSGIRADGKIFWLLGVICLTGGYDGTQVHMDIRLFGRSLLHKKPKKKHRRERKLKEQTKEADVADRDKQKKVIDQDTQESALVEQKEPVESKGSAEHANLKEAVSGNEQSELIRNGEIQEANQTNGCGIDVADEASESIEEHKLQLNKSESIGENSEPERRNISEKMDEKNKSNNRFSGIYRRIRDIFTGITRIPSKIWKKLCSICDTIRHLSERKERLKATIDIYLDFWHRTCTQAAKDHILKEVKYLLRHILPKKLEGTLTFGFEDPATTGQVLGILCVLAVFTGNHLEVNGDFEKPVLEGGVALKGHIRLCHIAKAAISLLTDKNIRKTIRDGRKLVGA